ncbi:MFS transporter [Lactobacillus terrae]|uniref:MFS transporter n=1 Tax=Lactobacillus terrae TaxID=2269374 RepID=UPI001FE5AFAF|nr:MFS transporter [Lactobacillus terrae]
MSMKNVQSKETILDQEQTLKNTLAVFRDMTKYSNILFIFLLSTVIVSMINAVFALLPDYISKIGFSSSANGGIFMIYSFVGGIIATQSYRLIKYSFRSLVTIISVILGLGIIFQVQSNKYIFLIGIGLLYIVEDIIDPIIMQILNKWVEDKSRATFISGLSFLTSLITMIINPLIGLIIMKYGTISMLVSSSIITILVIIIFYVVILRAGVTKDE